MKPKREQFGPGSLGGRLLTQFGEEPQTARQLVDRIDPHGKIPWERWFRAFSNTLRSEYIKVTDLPPAPPNQSKFYAVSERGRKQLAVWAEPDGKELKVKPSGETAWRRYGAYQRNTRFNIPTAELANELGADKGQMEANAKKAGVEIRLSRHSGTRNMSCVTEEGAEILREIYKEKRREVPAGYLDTQQAAAELKISERTFRARKKGAVRRVMVGWAYYYHPADIRAWKEREKERFGIASSPPRGGIGAKELVTLLNVPQVENVKKWRIDGCPAYPLSTGTYYYRLPEVLEWLEKRTDYRMKRYARRLRAYLETSTGGERV